MKSNITPTYTILVNKKIIKNTNVKIQINIQMDGTFNNL